jgi:hypothetical protein
MLSCCWVLLTMNLDGPTADRFDYSPHAPPASYVC